MLDFDSPEVRDMLDISGIDQRLTLHRGRSSVRTVLEAHVRGGATT